MKTTLIVVGSWIVGGCLVVLLSFALGEGGVAEAIAVSTRAVTGPAVVERVAGGIHLPVSGISPSELRDTFDAPRGSRRHDAIDILAPMGTPVVAAVDGTVRKLFTSKAGGLTIYQFDESESHVYYYAHLDRYRDGLAEGARLKRGETIGYVGVTGNAGSTPHLHFSIEKLPPTKEWWKGVALNPYPVLMAGAAGR